MNESCGLYRVTNERLLMSVDLCSGFLGAGTVNDWKRLVISFTCKMLDIVA